ncbi:MAG: Fic family protein [Proteobacteria bacterium]|nr:Fic family protein [Pseudomonadota bacterium]
MIAEKGDLLQLVRAAGPGGIAPDALARQLTHISRSTLNRRLAQAVAQGALKPLGAGRATRYAATGPLSRADIDAYFDAPPLMRPVARFREELLGPLPNIDADKALRCSQIQALASPIDKRFLANFVIDFSWGSSVLEGGTYSELDTEALVRYGQKNPDKPTADAVLVLNHKRAAEHLWAHRTLDMQNLCAMHALLTDDHALAEVADSDHFLPAHQRGKPREYEEINLGASAYIPPFRPGEGYVAQAAAGILDTAATLPPVQAALHLMTRLPYLQAFANGNKRTARLAANAPLLNGGLLPFSFADVDKREYIRGMAAFYELGDMHVMEQTFVHGYARSVLRGSNIPAAQRGAGFDLAGVAHALADFINTGRLPQSQAARVFIKSPPA